MKSAQDFVDEEYKKNPEEAMQLYDGKAVEEVIPLIVKSRAADGLARILSNRDESLKGRHKHIHKFQESNYLLRKEAFDLLETFISTNLEIGTEVITQSKEGTQPDFKATALIRNHSRACLITEEIINLLKSGFPDAALSRWRALHEISAIVFVITTNDQQCAERYLDHGIIDYYKGLVLTKDLKHESDDQISLTGKIDHYKQLYDQLLSKYGEHYKNPFGWASEVLEHKNPQFTDIEKYSRLSHMRPQYKQASYNIHAGPNGFVSALGSLQLDENIMLRAPSHQGIEGPAVLSCYSLGIITAALLNLYPSINNMISAELLNGLSDKVTKAFEVSIPTS